MASVEIVRTGNWRPCRVTCLVGVWAKAEVLDCLTMALWSTEEDDVGAGGRTQSQLVEGDALAACLLDARTSSLGEAEGADGHLWDLVETDVIGDGTNNGASLAFVRLCGVWVRGHSNDLRKRDWWLVDLAYWMAD